MSCGKNMYGVRGVEAETEKNTHQSGTKSECSSKVFQYMEQKGGTVWKPSSVATGRCNKTHLHSTMGNSQLFGDWPSGLFLPLALHTKSIQV